MNDAREFYETFWGSPITYADFSSLQTITGSEAATRLFIHNHALTRVGAVDRNSSDPSLRVGCDFSSLTRVDNSGLRFGFESCSALESVEFPSLQYINNIGMGSCFQYCTSLTSASFPALTSFGFAGTDYMFLDCSSLVDVDFSALTSGCALYHMFAGCTSLEEIEFPELSSLVTGSGGYAME